MLQSVRCGSFRSKSNHLRFERKYLPFLVVAADDGDVVCDSVSILDGIGIDPEPSFIARLSNLIDSVVAINNTFYGGKEKISSIKLWLNKIKRKLAQNN